MKNELLATLATLTEQINSLPDDPVVSAPVPPKPTGLTVSFARAGNNNTGLDIGLNWDDTTPYRAILRVKGAEDNPNGPQEWTQIDYNGAPADGQGIRQIYVLQNPVGQVLLFRLTARNVEGVDSEPLDIVVNADDYLVT